jgi:hypothetical protein
MNTPTNSEALPPTTGSPSSVIGDGFYRTTAPGTFGPSEWLDLMLAVQDGRCTCMKGKEIIEREIDARLENPPRHEYWGAGDPECPKEIKSGNGELHTLRCKKCGQDSPRSPICREFNPENDPGLATAPQDSDS